MEKLWLQKEDGDCQFNGCENDSFWIHSSFDQRMTCRVKAKITNFVEQG